MAEIWSEYTEPIWLGEEKATGPVLSLDQRTPLFPLKDEPALPPDLPILPLQDVVVFPMTIFPLAVSEPQAVQLVDDAVLGNRQIGLVSRHSPVQEEKDAEEQGPDKPPDTEQLYQVGTLALVHKLLKLPDGSLRIAVQGLDRIRVLEYVATEPYLRARVERAPEVVEEDLENEALKRNLLNLFQKVASLSPQVSEELQTLVLNIEDSRQLAYVLAASIRMDLAERQALLEEDQVKGKLHQLMGILNRELQVLELGNQIQSQVQNEMTKAQREYFLREQMKAIRQELGEIDEAQMEVERLRQALEEAGLPDEAKEQAERELGRLSSMPPAAAEYGVIRTYLEWLAALPWSQSTDDRLDVTLAQEVLDEDHYDLDKVKERILEFLAIRQLRRQRLEGHQETEGPQEAQEPVSLTLSSPLEGKGAILCFVGPPGVGKTSLGRSIARAMGREFIRISLGGVRDEAEIRGHRRTYIGAMPGTIIQAIRRVASNNPVFMMDEVDKIGADFRGDPASALLEVLDPEQNRQFRDHYLDVAFDLSKVFFITTANTMDTISPPLRDRMEIIRLSGYSEEEKFHIARRYLVPRQLKGHVLTEEDLRIEDETIHLLIQEYTREAGVRNLEREIGSLCRKVGREIASGATGPIVVDVERARSYLGPRRFYAEAAERTEIPGVATGLAWTPSGGEIIFIEATKMKGSKKLLITGQLGEVMQESAQAALSYVRSQAERLQLSPDFYDNVDVHIHIPEGAQPKDGPSAGVAMATALASLFAERLVQDDVAMTGEITLRGRVLPVGGIKEKVLAARRAGIKTVILPQRNEANLLEEVPQELRQDMQFVFVETVDEVWKAALAPAD
ncbi:MAG: endopeptidase La [Chloroflexia bacterium]|nr:endopeptidase La [Chloroflexia bacterium]